MKKTDITNKLDLFYENHIKNDKAFKKHNLKGTFLSGSSTYVYPVMMSDASNTIEIMWDSHDTRTAVQFIRRLTKYDGVKGVSFGSGDGSCPSYIWIKLND